MIAPTVAPKDVFGRVAHEEGYYGRLNLDDVEPDLRDLLVDFRNHLESAFVSQRECLWVGTEHPNLYFDYIDDGGEINALAFSEEGWAMVGVTHTFFKQMRDEVLKVCANREFVAFCRKDQKSEPPERELFVLLYLVASQFVVNHELGHHFHGHVPDAPLPLRRRREIAIGGSHNGLLWQAEEIEADGYAVHMTLNNMMSDGPRQHAASLFGIRIEDEQLTETLLRIFVAAVVVFFHVLGDDFAVATVYRRSHPYALARLNKIIQEMQGWCSRHTPVLSQWPPPELFAQFGACIRSALRMPGDTWDEQNEWLQSTAGRKYLDEDLQVARRQRRDEVLKFIWRIDRKCLPTSSSNDNLP